MKIKINIIKFNVYIRHTKHTVFTNCIYWFIISLNSFIGLLSCFYSLRNKEISSIILKQNKLRKQAQLFTFKNYKEIFVSFLLNIV